MENKKNNSQDQQTNQIPFKAETRQLLQILIHSLYKEREIFLRELISNASDALTRMNYELLTNRDVLDPQEELKIYINTDPENHMLMISDTGIGMTKSEIQENLGTIAQSGVRAFINAASSGAENLSDIIGQFGVGFYSAFMVAEWIKVTSRSFNPDAQAVTWYSEGIDTYSIEEAKQDNRGTSITIKLKEDSSEFLQAYRLKAIVQRHSDFIPFPIYIGDEEVQINRQTAIWRQQPSNLVDDDYHDFYKHLTFDIVPPILHIHMMVDAPVQMYAILYIPTKAERSIYSPRKDEGLKLYSRKILIDEYNRDLLPEYFRFIEGVVDSEDLPLNVSRETVQSNRLLSQLKKLLTKKVIDSLEKLAQDDLEKYLDFWESWGRHIKEGIATEEGESSELHSLLRIHTSLDPKKWSSLENYISRMKENQKEIYYILGENDRSVLRSPHLEQLNKYGYEVLLLTDPIDAFMLVRLKEFNGHPLINVSKADISLPKGDDEALEEDKKAIPPSDWAELIDRFKLTLAEKISDIRMTDRLLDSPARLVDKEGALSQELQRVYTYLDEKFEIPQKTLELNPQHPVLFRLNEIPTDHRLSKIIIEQIYEDALLIEGLHPDPSSMISRIQELMEIALEE